MRLPFEVAEFAQTSSDRAGWVESSGRTGGESVPQGRGFDSVHQASIAVLRSRCDCPLRWQTQTVAGWVEHEGARFEIFKHPEKPGIVVVAGKPGIDIPQGTWNSILRQAGLK